MVKLCDYLKRLALIFWLGEMLFFAFIFAPRVFRILPRPQAAELQAALFPPYFTVGVLCAVLILVCHLSSQWISGTGLFSKSERLSYAADRQRVLPILLTVIAGCIFAFCLLWLTPKIIEFQQAVLAGTGDAEGFKLYHRMSTTLNGIVLVMLLVLVAIL